MASVINVPASVTDPEGETLAVTAINDYTFSGAVNLMELNLPISVTSFGGEAIEGCMNLKRLNLHETLTHMGLLAFARSGLEEYQRKTKSLSTIMLRRRHISSSMVLSKKQR